MIIPKIVRHAALAAAMCVLASSLAEAQATGQIEGSVVDGRGLPVAGTTVTALFVATRTPYRIRTDDAGRYRFANLPPGTYEVTTAVSPSLGSAMLTVKVTMGASTIANFDPSTPAATSKRASGLGSRSIRLEASGRVGWTFSDGVSGRSVEAGDGNSYNTVDLVDAVSWGFTVGVFLTRHFEAEFLFDRQQSAFQVGGTRTVDVGDMSIGNYHGVLSYNFGAPDAPVRVYAFGGAGATSYGSLTFTKADGETREIGGNTRLSTTFGGGVKLYRGRVGARLEARLTPTYIKSNAVGWWCDEYWGCYLVEDAQYSNQFEFSGGVTVRF